MKKYILFAVFAAFSLCSNAQFKLTPSAGLMTEDGPYAISKSGTEAENYEAARKAVERTIPDAEIGELEYEKSFAVNSKFKKHGRLPGALRATDWVIDYQLKVEVTEEKVLISFSKVGDLVYGSFNQNKNDVQGYIYPRMGKNSLLVDMFAGHFLFNSKGEVGKGCQKMVDVYEEFANNLVKEIERNL